MAETATVTVKASQNTMVVLALTPHATKYMVGSFHSSKYLLLAGSSKEFTVDDSQVIQVGYCEANLVKPEPANATVTPL